MNKQKNTSSSMLSPGTEFQDKYRIVEVLGKGSFGTVYLARQEAMERNIALKVLKPEMEGRKKVKERFLREVRIISKLRHPNTVTIHDFGETGSIIYMVLEYIQGPTLKKVVKENQQLETERAVELTKQVLSSLSEAHKHDVVHRDLKPANIMVTNIEEDEDFVKVLDFGVARLMKSDEKDLTNIGVDTGERQLVGTPRYMSPEQVRGRNLTGASDIYSLGLILYELITGQKAVKGDTTMALITKQIKEQALQLPDINSIHPKLRSIIRRMTAKSQKKRYQNASRVKKDLDSFLDFLSSDISLGATLEPPSPGEGSELQPPTPGEDDPEKTAHLDLEPPKPTAKKPGNEKKPSPVDEDSEESELEIDVRDSVQKAEKTAQKSDHKRDDLEVSDQLQPDNKGDGNGEVVRSTKEQLETLEQNHSVNRQEVRTGPGFFTQLKRRLPAFADVVVFILLGLVAGVSTYIVSLISGPSMAARFGGQVGLFSLIAAPLGIVVFGAWFGNLFRRFLYDGEGFVAGAIRTFIMMMMLSIGLGAYLFTTYPAEVIEQMKFKPNWFMPTSIQKTASADMHRKFSALVGTNLKRLSDLTGFETGLIQKPSEKSTKSPEKRKKEFEEAMDKIEKDDSPAPEPAEPKPKEPKKEQKWGDEYEKWN